ncbi:sugar phosphate nucleotidyltransferase [Fidelibacter multiformis]|jgi:NDP-sugar pyrophosphorylase family protein|uniref:sugar phosphate nucleotidyltransferase n=1 Tax=Fidelibacter multiformis TaxID=3377529 RepID=UPI0037DC51CD
MDTQRNIAFIPAAGLGKRLKDETKDIPKALVEVQGKPMIFWILKKISAAGITDFVINIHHHADKLIAWLSEYQISNSDIRIHMSLEKDRLLDTGGALKKARPILENFSHVLVHNVDIFSDFNVSSFMEYSISQDLDALLLVSDRKSSRYLLLDQSMKLCGWENRNTDERLIIGNTRNPLKARAFSGIYSMSPELLNHVPEEDVFSVIPWFLHLSNKHKIFAFEHDVSHWYDAGKPPSLKVLREMSFENFKQMTETT